MKYLHSVAVTLRSAIAPLPAYHIQNISLGRYVWRPRNNK